MDIIDLLQSLVSGDEWIKTLNAYKKKNKVPMRIRNKVFGAARFWPQASIPWSQLKETLTNIPVVRRGTNSYLLGSDGLQTESITPHGFNTVTPITAAELNNLKAIGVKNLKTWVDGVNMSNMRKFDVSTEALCAQAITGEISYPMKTEAGAMEVWQVDYGETQTYTFDEKLTSADADIMDVYKALQAMDEQLQSKGFGANVETLCGKDLFAVIGKLAGQSQSNILKVEVNKGSINIGGYIVTLENGSYQTYSAGSKVATKTVPADRMVMIDIDAGHTLWYASIDDIDAGMKALPFFSKVVKVEDPSGANLYNRSKPLPAVVVDAICWADGAM